MIPAHMKFEEKLIGKEALVERTGSNSQGLHRVNQEDMELVPEFQRIQEQIASTAIDSAPNPAATKRGGGRR
jgi:hypothetical protein